MPPKPKPSPPQTVIHADRFVEPPGKRPLAKKVVNVTPPGPPEPSLGSKLLAELLGTFMLTVTVAMTAAAGQEPSTLMMAPMAIGSTLMCAVYGA